MSGITDGSHEAVIVQLLEEYRQNREALKELLTNLENIQTEVANIFPEKIDKRFRYLFEEKIKTATSFFNSLLDIRKEISRSLKDEMDLRRKLSGSGSGELEDLLDIGALADRVEKVQREQERISAEGNKN
jgi:hypothetical protein